VDHRRIVELVAPTRVRAREGCRTARTTAAEPPMLCGISTTLVMPMQVRATARASACDSVLYGKSVGRSLMPDDFADREAPPADGVPDVKPVY
jgi:hypothetical protein